MTKKIREAKDGKISHNEDVKKKMEWSFEILTCFGAYFLIIYRGYFRKDSAYRHNYFAEIEKYDTMDHETLVYNVSVNARLYNEIIIGCFFFH